MKDRMLVRLIVLALLLVATPAIVQAQYTVRPGDTLWRLSGDYLSDPQKWGEVVGANSFLKEAGRQFQLPDGRIVLLIRPGEVLKGLNDLGLIVEPVSIDQLNPSEPVVKTVEVEKTPKWLWWLIGALGLMMIASLIMSSEDGSRNREREAAEEIVTRERKAAEDEAAREWELTRNPITSGTPYVAGGIVPTETARLENFFNQQAVGRYAERNPQIDRTNILATRIGPIERGTIVGEGMVGYLGGEMRPRRITTPIPAYQARYRFPDGSEELLVCLMGCMNPISYSGDVYRGFTFTPTGNAVSAPEPVVISAETTVAPVAEEVPATASIAAVIEQQHPVAEDGVVKFEIRQATADQPAMVRMTGIDETANTTCEIKAGSVVLRFTPRNNTAV